MMHSGTTMKAAATIIIVAVSPGLFLLSKKAAAAAKTATTAPSYPPALEYPTIPNSANIAAALNKHFAGIGISNIKIPTSNSLYEIEEAFGAAANYWKDKVQDRRCEKSPSQAPLLYRSQITEELFQRMQETLSEDSLQGIVVKGPQGIGKSHSLVNFVLKLQTTGDYLVTFIPDCDRWDTDVFILRMICDSFGAELYGPNGIASLDLLAGSEPSSAIGRKEDLHMIVEAIVAEVAKRGKKWVFVFDQIDGLLQDRDTSSISSLRYPFI
jgi:Cdc6-like AAA superfamily ATPase